MADAEPIKKGMENVEANRRILLRRRPSGEPLPADFDTVDLPVPVPADGEIVVRNLFISLDPAIRGWMDDRPSYIPPIPLGAVVRATVVGRVVASRAKGYAEGDTVVGLGGWELYSVLQPGGFTGKVDPDWMPLTAYLSVLGAVGLTAYFGTVSLLNPQPGQTVLVSAAAGAVGSLVGQIAGFRGARAVGIAGGPEKCASLIRDYGFAAAVDYKAHPDVPALADAIRAACPEGVDAHFENVGGAVLDAALMTINDGARIALCGMIAAYNDLDPETSPGQKALWQLVVHRANLRGFVVSEFLPQFAEGIAQMAAWVKEGRLIYREEIVEGLDNALPAFLRLFRGTNTGKLILQVGQP